MAEDLDLVYLFISCFKDSNTGLGGHYYSLRAFYEQMKPLACIVVVGDFFPQAYSDIENEVFFLRVKKINALFSIKKVANRFPAISGARSYFHAFDTISAIFASTYAARSLSALIVTKPGGPPVNRYSTIFRNMIVFQPEDFKILSELKFKPRNLALISNRVSHKINSNDIRQSPFLDSEAEMLKLLRIARIGKTYFESIIQSINLLEKIQREIGKATLVIIGVVEDESILSAIISKIGSRADVKVLTTPEFTFKAAHFVKYCDIVIATGRGVGEAMSESKRIFVPVTGCEYPAFLCPATYDQAFYKNFSPRLLLQDIGTLSFDEFKSTIDEEQLTCHREWMSTRFNEDHLLSVGVSNLLKFYERCTSPVGFLEVLVYRITWISNTTCRFIGGHLKSAFALAWNFSKN